MQQNFLRSFRSIFAGMTESAFTTFGFVQCVHFYPFSSFVACNDHLADAFTVFYHKIVSRKIDNNGAYFTTVIGINSARCLER